MENGKKNINIIQNGNQLFDVEIKDEISDTEYNDEESYGSFKKCMDCDNKLYQTSLETFVANDENWKCSYCSIDYNSTSNESKRILVENYSIKEENEKNYKCNICNVSFIRERYLIAHERIHSEDKVYDCNICNTTFTQHSNLIRHEKFHNIEKTYECKLCGKSFNRERYLNVHERIHSEEKVYECNICNQTFLQHSNLLLHNRIHIENKSKYFNENLCKPDSQPQVSTSISHKCKICEKTFSSLYRLTKHRVLHGRKKCRICNKIFPSAKSLRNHRRNTCCVCEMQFSTRFLLSKHKRTCSAHIKILNEYKCEKCSKLFATKGILKAHEKSHNKLKLCTSNTSYVRPKIDSYEIKVDGEEISYVSNSFSIDDNIKSKTFKCSKCNLSFYQEICLIKHESIHNGAYRCKICDEIFLIKYHLKLHKKLHLNRTPCTCECKRKFYHGRYLMLHTKLHEGGQRFNCIYCGQDFKNFDDLTQHEKYHLTNELDKEATVPEEEKCKCKKCNHYKCICNKLSFKKYECAKCEKSFNSRCNLMVHERIHTGEKPYKCKKCNKAFTQLSHFNAHLKKKHNLSSSKRKKTFKCSGCGKLYKTQPNLNLHIQSQTGEKPVTCNLCFMSFSLKCNYQKHMKHIHEIQQRLEINSETDDQIIDITN